MTARMKRPTRLVRDGDHYLPVTQQARKVTKCEVCGEKAPQRRIAVQTLDGETLSDAFTCIECAPLARVNGAMADAIA